MDVYDELNKYVRGYDEFSMKWGKSLMTHENAIIRKSVIAISFKWAQEDKITVRTPLGSAQQDVFCSEVCQRIKEKVAGLDEFSHPEATVGALKAMQDKLCSEFLTVMNQSKLLDYNLRKKVVFK